MYMSDKKICTETDFYEEVLDILLKHGVVDTDIAGEILYSFRKCIRFTIIPEIREILLILYEGNARELDNDIKSLTFLEQMGVQDE